MIAEGFASVDEFKKETRENFKVLNARIDTQDKSLVLIEDKIDKIDLQLEQLAPAQERITALETHVAAMQKQIDRLQLQAKAA